MTELKWRAHTLLHSLLDQVEREEECTDPILTLAHPENATEMSADQKLKKLVNEFLRFVV